MSKGELTGYKMPGMTYQAKYGTEDKTKLKLESTLDWQNAQMYFALPWTQTEDNQYRAGLVEAWGITHLSIADFVPKHPVTSWGSSGIKGITSGPKSVAGSMIISTSAIPFTNTLVKSYMESVFQQNPNIPGSIKTYNFSVSDLPPMDVTVVVPNLNILGTWHSLVLKGFTFVDSNWVLFNINNPASSQTLTFICHGVTLLE